MRKFFIAVIVALVAIFIMFMGLSVVLLYSSSNFVNDYYGHADKGEYQFIYDNMTSADFKTALSFRGYQKLMDNISFDLGKTKKWEKKQWIIQSTPGNWYLKIPCAVEREKTRSLEIFVLEWSKKKWVLHAYDVKT
ncbi:MAG: hypothetical protein PHW46_04205 [Candidatus Omnitrophica bacterium]|nr:hypothetical protein [Candidatus Omnitrophota bacterium]